MMGLFKSIAGLVTVELTSADISGSLRLVNDLGVPVFDVRTTGDLSAEFTIYRRNFRKITALAKKKGLSVRLLTRDGLYWKVKSFLRRPALTVGLALLLILVLFVPSRVLFIEVEGNETLPARLILAAAEESGIRFGASRREVRSEKMKNALLSRVPQLQWAGVNTYGCTAVITVRERAVIEETEEQSQVSSIVAARDGVILSYTVTNGNGLCAAGQAVREGETLISAYTDCGLCITATRAEGEIMARTHRNLAVITPAETSVRGVQQEADEKYSLLFGKNRINFYKGSGISDAGCVKMYSKYVLTLPGGFELPVTLVEETVIRCEQYSAEVSEAESYQQLTAFAERYLRQQMVAGTITDRAETIVLDGGVWCLTGEYACTENIGKVRLEQIGEYHETD